MLVVVDLKSSLMYSIVYIIIIIFLGSQLEGSSTYKLGRYVHEINFLSSSSSSSCSRMPVVVVVPPVGSSLETIGSGRSNAE